MSSHYEWEEEVIARHNSERPFAPENGNPLKFKVGDNVIYTNECGLKFNKVVTGFYKPDKVTGLYARGYRYFLNTDDKYPFPKKESELRLADKQ
jgi:hypothetical protein